MSMYERVKKDSKWTILELGSFDISDIKAEIEQYSDEWFIDTSRQDNAVVHGQTNMYRICATDYDWVAGSPIETIQYNSLKTEKGIKQLQDIYNILQDYYNGKVVRCEFIKLPAHRQVLKHVDGKALLHYARRVHIPLITNDKVMFTVNNNTINMKEAVWYEINNQMPHAVDNPSDEDRIHLIIDTLPDQMLYLTKKEQINDNSVMDI